MSRSAKQFLADRAAGRKTVPKTICPAGKPDKIRPVTKAEIAEIARGARSAKIQDFMRQKRRKK